MRAALVNGNPPKLPRLAGTVSLGVRCWADSVTVEKEAAGGCSAVRPPSRPTIHEPRLTGYSRPFQVTLPLAYRHSEFKRTAA